MSDDLMGKKTGIQTVVAEAHDAGALPPGMDEGEQAALFPLSKVDNGAMAQERGLPARGKGGRKPGSTNKSTSAWREFILSQFPSPLQGLATIAFRPMVDLAAELKTGDLVEVLKIQIACMKELAPYMHSKMPIAIDAGEKGLINLFIGGGQFQHNPVGSHGVMNAEFLKINDEQNQGVGADDAADSNGLISNGSDISQSIEGDSHE